MPRSDRVLLGEAGLLDATTAIAIGIPATPGGGKQWKLSRAALPHSLKSVVATCNEDGITLQMERNRLIAALSLAKKALPLAERPPRPPKQNFERSLQSCERNPADIIALCRVANAIVASKEPVALPEMVRLYLDSRKTTLELVRQHFYASLKVPAYDGPLQIQLIRDTITTALPVMAFPYYFPNATSGAGVWCYALLPDVPSIDTDEVWRVVSVWYRVLATELGPRAGLTAQQLADIKAMVPTGMPPLMQYLVVTLTNQATWRNLGISDGEASAVRTRFDALTLREAPKLRLEAEAHVMQKVIKSSGRPPKDLARAVENRMRTRTRTSASCCAIRIKCSCGRRSVRCCVRLTCSLCCAMYLHEDSNRGPSKPSAERPAFESLRRQIAHNFSASFSRGRVGQHAGGYHLR
jgi:hypothetical protein